MTVNISLTPQQESRVRERVASGEYTSISEVMRAALRLLDQQDELRELRLKELREEVRVGVRQAGRGEVVSMDDTVFEDIKKRGRQRLKVRNR